MFGWFKRKSKPATLAASWDHELPKYTFVMSRSVAPIRVLESNEVKAMDLLANIEYAKRDKKKHSHLLEELKALEVK